MSDLEKRDRNPEFHLSYSNYLFDLLNKQQRSVLYLETRITTNKNFILKKNQNNYIKSLETITIVLVIKYRLPEKGGLKR